MNYEYKLIHPGGWTRTTFESHGVLTIYTNQSDGYVVVNFLFQLIFIFPLFWGMVMYANEFKTKEKQKLTATEILFIKIKLQNLTV